MDNSPKPQKNEKINLDPKEPIGYFTFKNFKVRYNVETETQKDINKQNPANHEITTGSDGSGETLSVWV